MTLFAFAEATAKVTIVGGTFKSLNVPDMLSFPPIAGIPSFICAWKAPSKAASTLPHFSG